MTCPAKITIKDIDHACMLWRDHGPKVLHDVIVDGIHVNWPEKVAPTERDIPAGQVVVDATRKRYTRREDGDDERDKYPWVTESGDWEVDARVIRPLTFLVPEPDPVDLDALADLMLDISGPSFTVKQDARAVVEHLGLRVKP